MKLICPGCGLKGTADEVLLKRNVRCPACRIVFTLDEKVLVDVSILRKNDAVRPVAAEDASVNACESCGFRYSRAYLVDIDSRLYCQICASAGLPAEATS